MRATTTPALFARSRGVAASVAAAALALTLVPGSALRSRRTPTRSTYASRWRDQAPVEVATTPRVWPGEFLETQGVPVDGNDLVDVVRDGREVSGPRKRLREGDVVRLTDVVKERKTKRERVSRGTVEVFTTELEPGRRKVVREGRAGVRKVVALRTLHNGEPVKYRVVKKKLVRDPRPRRVLVGQGGVLRPRRRRAQLGRAGQLRVRRQPARGEPGRLLRALPVRHRARGAASAAPASRRPPRPPSRPTAPSCSTMQRGRSPWPNCGRLL